MPAALRATHPVNSNLSGVDASDYVRFAVVVQNTGHAAAFDVQIKDTIPAGFVTPAGGLDLCVANGAGTAIGTSNIGVGGLFGDGIKLTDGANGSLAPGVSAGVPNGTGTNLVVITYTLQVASSVVPSSVVTNTASLLDYTNDPGGAGHLPVGSPLTDTATVTMAPPAAAKIMTATNQGHTSGTSVAIGEIVTYQVTLTIPEGTLPVTRVVDTLPSGLAMVDCSPITASAGVSSSVVTFGAACVAGTNPTVGAGGQLVTFDFGTVTNTNAANGTAETITITYRAVVLNVGGNVRGALLHNSAVMSWATQ